MAKLNILAAQTPLTIKLKLESENIINFFVTHQKFSKISNGTSTYT